MASLVDKSLLRQEEQAEGETRFWMLQTLREFGLEQLAKNGELEATRQAHAEFYLQLAEEAQPSLRTTEQGRWMARLEQEHENLRAALFWLLTQAQGGSEQSTQRRLGCNVIWLEPDGLKQMFPSMNVSDLGAAVYSPDDGWLVNRSVLMGFQNKATSMGVEFLADEVVGLVRKGNSVTTAKLNSGQQIEASHFINAAGAWAKDICAMLDIHVPIEPLRRFEHYFESQDPIEPLPYIKDTQRLAFRPEGNGYSGGVPTLQEPRGYNFDVDGTYFERVVWPALAHRFPQFEKTVCKGTRSGLYDQNDFDGNVIIGPGADGLGNFYMLVGFSGHGLMHAPGCGRAVAELLLKGRYETIDLTRFGWQRLLDGTPIREQGII
jgi:FAD-dependent oxidoreductase domain-containing protein 1